MFTKIAIGCSGVGLGGGAIIGSYIYLKSDWTIEQLLKKESNTKTKLNDSTKQQEGWLKKWTDYVTANTDNSKAKDKDIFEIAEWSQINAEKSKVPEPFVKKCVSLLSEKIKDEKDTKYTNYIKWCTK